MAERVFVLTKGGIARIMRVYDDRYTPEDCIAKWSLKDRSEYQEGSVREITNDDVPSTADGLKDAWEDIGGKIVTNPGKAQAIISARK